MKFEATRVTEATFPGVLVAAGVAVINLATRAMDAKAGREKTLNRINTWAHAGIMGGSLLALGYNKMPDVATAAIIADVVPLSDRILTPLVEQAVGVKLQVAGPVPAAMIIAPSRTRALTVSAASAPQRAPVPTKVGWIPQPIY